MAREMHAASPAVPAGHAKRPPAAAAAASPAIPTPLGTLCGICCPQGRSCDCDKGDLEGDLKAKKVDQVLAGYALSAVAREWMWNPEDGLKGGWHRLAGCHRWLSYRTGEDGGRVRARAVDLLHDPIRLRAYYGGLQTCGLAWVDPVCSRVIYDYRRGEVQQALTWAREKDYKVFFITLTAQHSRAMRLDTLLDQMGEAMRLVYSGSGRSWRRFRDKLGYVGSIKGVEITYGKHGHHPHYHLLWIGKTGSVDEVLAYLDAAWRSALSKVGLKGLKGIAVNVKESSMTAGEYMTKFGHDRNWDLDAELTMWSRKVGHKQRSATPWDLLRAGLNYNPSTDGPERGEIVAICKRIFREYAEATKGKHSLTWSKGLKALVGVKDASDEEAANSELNDRELVLLARLTVEQWRVVLANDCRGELLQRANGGDVAAVVAFLALIGVHLDPAYETAALAALSASAAS